MPWGRTEEHVNHRQSRGAAVKAHDGIADTKQIFHLAYARFSTGG
jgi:hypothetical protein